MDLMVLEGDSGPLLLFNARSHEGHIKSEWYLSFAPYKAGSVLYHQGSPLELVTPITEVDVNRVIKGEIILKVGQ